MAAERYLAAAVQMDVRLGEPERNLRKAVAMIDLAAANGARLVALPECSNVGYIFDDRQQCFDLSTRSVPLFLRELGARAKEHGIHIAVGLSEAANGGMSWNSAFLIDSRGEVAGRWCKHSLVSYDWNWFMPSDTGFPVFETELGRLGMFICGDGRLFENARSLAIQGAQVLLDLTNWVPPEQYLYNTPTRAIENRAWVVAADKVGVERGLSYLGNSFIMDPLGEVVAWGSGGQEEVVYGEIEPGRMAGMPEHDLLGRRRPDTYELLARPTADLPVSQIINQAVVPGSTTVTVAVVQPNAFGKSKEVALADATALVENAARLNARIVVLPQCFAIDPALAPADSTGMAETVPGPTVDAMARAATATGIWVAYGLLERAGDAVYDTVVLTSPDRPVAASCRRAHLRQDEERTLGAGDDYRVVETPWGSLGLMVGFDGWFPEVCRILMLKGADMVLWPTAWMSAVEMQYLAPERALGNRVFLVAACRSGGRYPGQSMILDPRGRVLAQMADDRTLIQVHVDLVHARCKELMPRIDVLRSRRPELYGTLCASQADGSA